MRVSWLGRVPRLLFPSQAIRDPEAAAGGAGGGGAAAAGGGAHEMSTGRGRREEGLADSDDDGHES